MVRPLTRIGGANDALYEGAALSVAAALAIRRLTGVVIGTVIRVARGWRGTTERLLVRQGGALSQGRNVSDDSCDAAIPLSKIDELQGYHFREKGDYGTLALLGLDVAVLFEQRVA